MSNCGLFALIEASPSSPEPPKPPALEGSGAKLAEIRARRGLCPAAAETANWRMAKGEWWAR